MVLNKKRRELTNDICEVLLGRLTPTNNQPKKKKKMLQGKLIIALLQCIKSKHLRRRTAILSWETNVRHKQSKKVLVSRGMYLAYPVAPFQIFNFCI